MIQYQAKILLNQLRGENRFLLIFYLTYVQHQVKIRFYKRIYTDHLYIYTSIMHVIFCFKMDLKYLIFLFFTNITINFFLFHSLNKESHFITQVKRMYKIKIKIRKFYRKPLRIFCYKCIVLDTTNNRILQTSIHI